MSTGGDVGFNLDSVIMKAPGNYDPLSDSPKGLMNLQIGTWFKATKQVLISADFDFSKEVAEDGTPLIVSGKLTFEPYRAITHTEMMNYFITAKPNTPTYKA